MARLTFMFLAAFASLFSAAASGQTCAAQAGDLTNAAGAVAIDTCSSTNQLLTACNGVDAIGASYILCN